MLDNSKATEYVAGLCHMGDGGLVTYYSECFKPPMPLRRQGAEAGHRCRWRHVLLVMGHRMMERFLFAL
jgi:hypothetical protein